MTTPSMGAAAEAGHVPVQPGIPLDSHCILRVILGFEDTSLPKQEWTHSAHLLVALHHLRSSGREAATRLIRNGIQAFNAAKGGPPDRYHETVTLAWIRIAERFLSREDHGGPFPELAERFIAKYRRSDFLLDHYRKETLDSVEARSRWVEPDLAAFDSCEMGRS